MTRHQKVLPLLEKAFDLPVYMGDLSKARLRPDGPRLLAEARLILTEAADSDGRSARDHYCLGLISRYMEHDEDEFRQHMRDALALDSDFLEAELALRDGFVYQDAFCYPTREDLVTGGASFRPSIVAGPQPKNCRVEYVRSGLELVPAVVVKYPREKFRSALSEDTGADILVDIEAIMPEMPAMMVVIPVVFDDEDDPFWLCTYVNLFPIEPNLGGLRVYPPSDYRPFEGRDYATRLFHNPAHIALFVLDSEQKLMFSRLLPCPDERRERMTELAAVVEVLGDKTVSYDVWKSATDIHDQSFRREVRNPSGRVVGFPKSNENARKRLQDVIVFPVVAFNDRLTAKRGRQEEPALRRSRKDVFLIHAHGDQAAASALRTWLLHIWPSLKMCETSPDDEQRFQRDPLFFMSEMHYSKCIIFLATKLSITRPWIEAELGGAERQPVITVLAEGAAHADLEKMREGDLFSKIDFSRVADCSTAAGWDRLAVLLGDALGRPVPSNLPEGPALGSSSAEAIAERRDALQSSFVKDLERTLLLEAQTESQAAGVVDMLEDEIDKLALKAGETIRWELLPEASPRRRLARILMTIDDEAILTRILRAAPAFLDDELVQVVLVMREGALINKNSEIYGRAERLLELIRRLRLERKHTRS